MENLPKMSSKIIDRARQKLQVKNLANSAETLTMSEVAEAAEEMGLEFNVFGANRTPVDWSDSSSQIERLELDILDINSRTFTVDQRYPPVAAWQIEPSTTEQVIRLRRYLFPMMEQALGSGVFTRGTDKRSIVLRNMAQQCAEKRSFHTDIEIPITSGYQQIIKTDDGFFDIRD